MLKVLLFKVLPNTALRPHSLTVNLRITRALGFFPICPSPLFWTFLQPSCSLLLEFSCAVKKPLGKTQRLAPSPPSMSLGLSGFLHSLQVILKPKTHGEPKALQALSPKFEKHWPMVWYQATLFLDLNFQRSWPRDILQSGCFSRPQSPHL